MKTNVQDTSISAFYQEQRHLNRRERELLDVLSIIQPASDRDLAYKLSWEIGQVNGRRNELVKKGKIIEHHRARSPITGKRVIYWEIKKGQEALL